MYEVNLYLYFFTGQKLLISFEYRVMLAELKGCVM